jgi:hypothetical protein
MHAGKQAAPFWILVSAPTIKVQHPSGSSVPNALRTVMRTTHLDILKMELHVVYRIKLYTAVKLCQPKVENKLVTPRYIPSGVHPIRSVRPTANKAIECQ